MVNEKIQSELNKETKLTGALLKSIGIDKYSVNNYIYSLGVENEKEPVNEIKSNSKIKYENIKENTLDDIINKKVDEKLWSDRLWTNKNEIAKDLRSEIRDFLNGKITVNEIEDRIKKKYNTNAHETKRLVQDNVARVQESVNEQWREDNAIKYVLYMATLCSNTCADCRQYDGKPFEVDKKPVLLPQHPFCRCTYVNIPNPDWHPKMRLDNETKENINWQSYKQWANGSGTEYIKMKRKDK
jgi:SPP1 gp7 family putative phage head morphogenesis protein